MSLSESDSMAVSEDEDDEEGKIYQWIFEMIIKDNKEEAKEEDQIPSRSENSPVHHENDAERTDVVVADAKGRNMDALKNIQEIPVGYMRVDNLDYIQEIPALTPIEEKPWRKAGADISDYFNYGFDEKSWNYYCKKQAKVRAANRKLYTQIKIQRGNTSREEDKFCYSYPSLDSPSLQDSRQSSATLDVIGGRPGVGCRVEGCRCLGDEEYNNQVTEVSSKADICASYLHPSNFSSLFEYVPPPPFLYQPATPASSSFPTLDRQSKGFDDHTATLQPHLSGVPSLIPRGMVSNAGVINTAKAWECYIWQEKCERDRSRVRGHDREGRRGRDRHRQRWSSTHRREEQMRRRDSTKRGHKRHRLARSCEKKHEEQHREKRHKDDNAGGSGSRSKKDGGEDRETQSRQKKAKRKRKDKETSEMFSADPERKLKTD